jgi:very-short-patch-repair endonuclease
VELHVGVLPPARAVRIAGVVGHRLDLATTDVRRWLGVRVTAPARTWRDLGSYLVLGDLVAAGDFLLHGPPALALLADLEREAANPGRGTALLRSALPLLDARSESRRETRLRLILQGAGIRGYEANYRVTLPRPRVRYRIDIAFPDRMLGIEYQSEYHHDPEQWRKDMTRLSRLRAHGWNMHEVSKTDLENPDELAYRIRLLLERGAS